MDAETRDFGKKLNDAIRAENPFDTADLLKEIGSCRLADIKREARSGEALYWGRLGTERLSSDQERVTVWQQWGSGIFPLASVLLNPCDKKSEKR